VFEDPQTVTIGAFPNTLNRTGMGIDSGVFKTADASYSLSISHAYNKRTRRSARLDYKVLAPDVMDSSLNVPYNMAIYTVVDVPNVGISLADQTAISIGYINWLEDSTFANLALLLNGEA